MERGWGAPCAFLRKSLKCKGLRFTRLSSFWLQQHGSSEALRWCFSWFRTMVRDLRGRTGDLKGSQLAYVPMEKPKLFFFES